MLNKETLDSWYEPRQFVTEKEELIAEESVCEICEGEGEIDEYVYDTNAHEYVWDGTKKCVCQMKVAEYDTQELVNNITK